MVKSPPIQKTEWQRVITWLALLTIPALLMVMVEIRYTGEFGCQTPDARVYISIADNFVKTGHFIQTERPISGMVVPPGVPAVLTFFRLLNFSNRMIIAVQILMFGLSNIMLYETERRIIGKAIWAPIMFTMAYMRCWLGLGLFFVEHYYLFLLCLAIWIIYKEYDKKKKIILLNVLGLAMTLTRPILSPIYLTVLIYTLLWCLSRKNGKMAVMLLLLPVVVLSLNIAINYRETGEIILLENYSGSDLYTATRSDAPIHIEEARHFQDEVYNSIMNNESLSMSKKNNLFKELANDNLKDHFGICIKNSVLRFHELFMKAYAWATIYTLIGGIMLAAAEKKEGKWRATIMLLLTIVLAVVSSFGVSECRYSIVIWPMASLHGAFITHRILNRVFQKQ